VVTREQQIAHIKENQALFNEHQVSETDVDVDTYFLDAEDPYIYWYLCSDMEITPLEPMPDE
jgi:hypothetical protein